MWCRGLQTPAAPAKTKVALTLETGLLQQVDEPRAGFPLTLESRATGLKKRPWIEISQIGTLSDRIGARLARASEEELARS